ncbi:MAG TPA: cytochrome C oxidase subunit IV family protein [Candidatus Sulfotelmatobacter sp.]
MSAHSTSSPIKKYLVIWGTLLVGTYVTYKVAFIDLRPFNAAIALTIASIKATLVALFFMHLRGASEKMTKVVVASALFFLLLLLSLTMADYASRAWS